MEIILNKCYGGFSLSHKAIMRYGQLKNTPFIPCIAASRDGDRQTFVQWSNGIPSTNDYIYYFLERPHPERTTFTWDYGKDGTLPIFDTLDYDNLRVDPILIQVVKELREDANGRFADLRVVDIPDGVEYEINEYDGRETVTYGYQLGNA